MKRQRRVPNWLWGLLAVVLVVGLVAGIYNFTSIRVVAVTRRAATTTTGVAYPPHVCGSSAPTQLLLPPTAVANMRRTWSSSSSVGGFQSPVVSAPVETVHAVRLTHIAEVWEILQNMRSTTYESATLGHFVRANPNVPVYISETIIGFKRASEERGYFNLISKVDPLSLLLYGSRGLRIEHQLTNSHLFILRNRVYSLKTIMPNAPVLIVYALRNGSTIVSFDLYGGVGLTVANTHAVVSAALNRLTSLCSNGQLL